jgi:WD40 repeat protein
MFATASRDKTIKLWDFSSGRLLKVLDTVRYGGHVNSVNRLLWVDNVLLSASDDRTVSIWEIGNQTLARTT